MIRCLAVLLVLLFVSCDHKNEQLNAHLSKAKSYMAKADSVLKDTSNSEGLYDSFVKHADLNIDHALKLDSSSTEANYLKGYLLSEYLDKYNEAISYLRKSLAQDENSDKAYNQLALTYYYLKDYNKSLKNISKAIELNPNSSEYYSFRALIEANNLSKYNDAINDYTSMLQLDPKNESALSDRSRTYAKAGKYREAINDLSAVIKMDSGQLSNYIQRAIMKFEMGDFTGSLKDLDYFIKRNENTESWDAKLAIYQKGWALFKLGNKDDACKLWHTAAKEGFKAAQISIDGECK